MAEQQKEPIPPPKPPEIEREIKFYPNQLIGLPIIALLPILALFKVFDSTLDTVQSSSDGLALSVHYPTKIRYRTAEPMQITIKNETGSDQTELDIHISREYLDKFKKVTFEPDIEDIDKDSYVVELKDVKADEERRVDLELETDIIGNHSCKVWASTEGAEASAEFKTFVYP
ncbi:MAG: hypothetical protein ACAH95_09400 [Fimbriimonas sp.]